MMLGNKDAKILKLLQGNARLSVRTMAKQLIMPPTTIHSRIKKMEREGVIKSYTTVLDESKLGVGAKAFVFVTLSARSKKASLNNVLNEIAKYPEVREVCAISGDWDVLIKIMARNTDDVGNFVIKNIRKIKGVEKTFTAIVFGTYKDSDVTVI